VSSAARYWCAAMTGLLLSLIRHRSRRVGNVPGRSHLLCAEGLTPRVTSGSGRTMNQMIWHRCPPVLSGGRADSPPSFLRTISPPWLHQPLDSVGTGRNSTPKKLRGRPSCPPPRLLDLFKTRIRTAAGRSLLTDATPGAGGYIDRSKVTSRFTQIAVVLCLTAHSLWEAGSVPLVKIR
jgi:hypothetical protein